VSAGPTLASSIIGSLVAGEVVVVLEITSGAEEGHVRARLEDPLGWISLLELSTGSRWAMRQTPSPVIMHSVFENDRLGLVLNEDLAVTRLADARAAEAGWSIGDQVLQVNCIPVATKEDFLDEVQRAAVLLKDRGQPLKFDILRAGPVF